MKRTRVFCLLLVLVASVLGGWRGARAYMPPVETDFLPISYEEQLGIVTIELTYKVGYLSCTEVKAVVTCHGEVKNLGIETWEHSVTFPPTEQPLKIERDRRPTFSQTLKLWVPPGDTSYVSVDFDCPGPGSTGECYFVTTGDTIEYWPGQPVMPTGHPDAPVGESTLKRKPRERQAPLPPDSAGQNVRPPAGLSIKEGTI